MNYSNTLIFTSGMYSKPAIASIALLAAASPVFAAPVPSHDLETLGFLSDLFRKLFNSGEQSVESLLKDALVGSDLAGRDLEARDALADLISHIIGGGDQSIESIIRGALQWETLASYLVWA
jgi:hypothetical protein